MKKTIKILSMCIVISCFMIGISISANALTSGYYTYEISNGEATITDCNTLISGAVTIPSTLGGCPVTSIKYNAFSSCSKLTNVEIPDSVTSIGDSAFRGCSSLTSIKIPDSVTNIESSAFYECSSLTNIEIGDSVTRIGASAFSSCSRLTNVEIPDSVTSIGDSAFRGCSSLTSIKIPDSVTSIGDSAFNRCSSLTSVTIGNSVTIIGGYAFYGCTRLTSINIPDSVTSIVGSAFEGCSSLTGINVNTNNKNYCSVDGVLFNKSKTELIRCPQGKVGAYIIPDSVTSIGSSAFYGCSSLTSIEIGGSVISIGWEAFDGCSSLTSINISESNKNYCSVDGVLFNKSKTELIRYPEGKIGVYTIPDSVTSIGNSAFSSCTSLTSVTIGNGITSIEYFAFDGCSSLECVTIPDSVTCISDYAFSDCSKLTKVYYVGTESDFNNISIGPGNSYFTDAYIEYLSFECISISGPDVARVSENTIQEIRFVTNKNVSNMTCYIRYPNNFKLNKVRPIDFSNIEKINETTQNGYTILELDCKYKEDGSNIPKGKLITPFSILLEVDGFGQEDENLIEILDSTQYYLGNDIYNFEKITNKEIEVLSSEHRDYYKTVDADTAADNTFGIYMESKYANLQYYTTAFVSEGGSKAKYAAIAWPPTLKTREEGDGYPAQNATITKKGSDYIVKSNTTGVKYKMPDRITPSDSQVNSGSAFDLNEALIIDFKRSVSGGVGRGMSGVVEIGKSYEKIHFLIGHASDTVGDYNGNGQVQAHVVYNDGTTTLPEDARISHVSWAGKNRYLYDGDAAALIDAPESDGRNGYIAKTLPTITAQGQSDADNFVADFVTYVSPSGLAPTVNSTYAGQFATTDEKITFAAYEYTLTVDPTRVVKEIIFSQTSGIGGYAVLGITGERENRYITSVEISGSSNITKTSQYIANILPENADNKNIDWSVSDSTIATIDQNGLLTPIKNGEVKIYAKTLDGTNLVAEKKVTISRTVDVKVYDLSGNLIGEKAQIHNTMLDLTDIIPENTGYNLYADQDKTTEFDNSAIIKQDTVIYIEYMPLECARLVGDKSVMLTNKIAQRFQFSTDKDISYMICKIRYPEGLKLDKITPLDFEIVQKESEASEDGYTTVVLDCIYKEDGSMVPKKWVLTPFELSFEVGEDAQLGDNKIEILNNTEYCHDEKIHHFKTITNANINILPIIANNIIIIGEKKIDGESQYGVIFAPDNTTNRNVLWSVSDEKIATIGQTGLLMPITDGTVTIYAKTLDGSEITAQITVEISLPWIAKEISIIGEDAISDITGYQAQILPENVENKEVLWSVSDESIATIDEDGIVTPVKKGTVTIYAKTLDGSDLTAEKTISVSVKAKISSLTFDVGELDKEFNPNTRNYILYVPEATESVNMKANFTSGTMTVNGSYTYNNRTKTIALTGDTTTISVLRDGVTDHIKGDYTITVVKIASAIEKTISDNGKTFTIKASGFKTGSQVILALYKNDMLVEFHKADASMTMEPIVTTKEYDRYKIMVWDSLTSMQPQININ